MSQEITVELSDEVYDIIERQAREANISPAQVASTSLDRYFRVQQGADTEHKTIGARGQARKNKAPLQAARERFEKHFGSVDVGYPTGLNNEQIDADLERDYANMHGRG